MKNNLNKRYFLISFLITFCLVTLFSFISLVSPDKQTLTPAPDTPKTYTPTKTHDMTVLLIGEGKSKNYALLKASAEQNTLYLMSLPNQMKINDKTLSQTQEYLGAGYLKTTLNEHFGIEIDNFIRISEKTFVKVLDTLGAMPLKTSDDIFSYEHSFSLSKGEHILPFEKVIGVMKHNTEQGENYRLNEQTKILCEIVNKKINLEKIPIPQEFFNMAINLVDTDITAFDFDLRRDFITAFLENPKAVPLEMEFSEDYTLSDASKDLIKTHFGT